MNNRNQNIVFLWNYYWKKINELKLLLIPFLKNPVKSPCLLSPCLLSPCLLSPCLLSPCLLSPCYLPQGIFYPS